ncbi:aldehyde dehydrogenase family protein [Streptomyces sp. NPDC016459]|uniref:aldehyde dehydrogenase family protein n=1 Tax=Streptomyces sp. NPDC016459 TaxID=3157190 RepID=UPI0033CCECDD
MVDIGPEHETAKQEFFGSFAHVFRVASEEEGRALANPEQAQCVAGRIEGGMVYVDVVAAEEPRLPFGGVKASGFARELGRYGADEFANCKPIRIAG